MAYISRPLARKYRINIQ